MTMFRTAAVAAALLSTVAAPASAELINFDVDAAGNPIAANTSITNQYAAFGVTFTGLEDGGVININAAPDPDGSAVPSAPNVLTNCANASAACPGGRADIVRIDFANAASDISLSLNTLGSESVTFNLYDSIGALLETRSISGEYVLVNFASAGVSRIEGLQPFDGWAWSMDNLSFNSAGVPEPATWALMILGMGAVGGAMRRKQAVKTALRFA